MTNKHVHEPINQWFGVQRELKIYKSFAFILLFVALILGSILGLAINPDPIVIDSTGKAVSAHPNSIGPSKEEVRHFLKKFIKTRFTMKGVEIEKILKDMTPYSTEGYLVALGDELDNNFEGNKSPKEFTQYVAGIEVIVTDKIAQASFDKIIRIEGVPIVIPTEATFEITKDQRTKWNPHGILVNGVIEHERK